MHRQLQDYPMNEFQLFPQRNFLIGKQLLDKNMTFIMLFLTPVRVAHFLPLTGFGNRGGRVFIPEGRLGYDGQKVITQFELKGIF